MEKRNLLGEKELKTRSSSITSRLFTLESYKKSRLVMCYVSFGSEVQTTEIMRYSIACGKHIAVPIITDKSKNNRTMAAAEIFDIDSDLTEGNYGILEPKPDRIRLVDPAVIDFVVVPGVAFDANRYRLGYGGGYYDRFILRLQKGCICAGLAYELQLLDSVPREHHDMAVDFVITEDRLI